MHKGGVAARWVRVRTRLQTVSGRHRRTRARPATHGALTSAAASLPTSS
jgi:hypothetical protein